MIWLFGLLLAILPLSAHAQLPKTQCVSTAAAGGTGDAITIPLLPCTETTTLLVLTFTAANTTSAPTISVNGQTPHAIVNFDGTPLTASFLAANQRRILTYNGINWIILTGSGGGGSGCSAATSGAIGCVQPDNVTIGVNGSGVISVIDKPFDIEMFWPGVPPNAAIVRAAITRSVTCPLGLTGSVGNSRIAATGSAAITLNRVTSGVGTPVGTATFATSATTASFSASPAITLSPGDDLEFAFPGSADATLADIAVTLKCSRN